MFVDGGEHIDFSAVAEWQSGFLIYICTVLLLICLDKHLWELDLSAKFNTLKPPWTAHVKPDDWNRHYNGALGTLWNLGDDTFYTLGGIMSAYEGPPPGYRIWDPYFTTMKAGNGSTTYKFQLPPAAIHAYNTTTANWTAISLPSNIHRLTHTGYTQSRRNKVGYMLGGVPIVEQEDGGLGEDFTHTVVEDRWKTTLSAYDFRKNTFNISVLPLQIGPVAFVVLHSLDRVGDEGVLIALGGQRRPSSTSYYVSYGSCLWNSSDFKTKSSNSARTNSAPRDTHQVADA